MVFLTDMDYVLLQLGSPGRYQLFIAFLLCCLQIPISFSNNLWKFYGEEPPHRCYVPYWMRNGTSENDWIPKVNTKYGVTSYSSCEMYIDTYNHWRGTQRCIHGWEYKPSDHEQNAIIQWDLVCERRYMASILFYSANLAAIIGALILGMMADRIERKSTLLLSLYLFVATAFSMHFVQDYISFAICFALQNFFIAGVQVASYVLLMEIMPTPYQLQATLFCGAFTIVSAMILPLFIWVIASWRYVQLAISAPGVVFFAHLWILPKSPIWLISEGKMTETENMMEDLGKQNGKSMPPSFRLHLQNFVNLIKNTEGFGAKRHQILSKFSSPSLRWYLLCNFYLFFVVYLSIDVTDSQILRLHENKYADCFYRGLMDLGTITLTYQIALRLGPRAVQSLLFVFAGLLMMIAITLQEMVPEPYDKEDKFDYRLLLLPSTLVSVARSLLVVLSYFLWFHAAKTLPTGIRVIGFAYCYTWGLIGRMSASNLLVLADLIAPFIPIGLCGSLSMIAGGLSLLFPNCWRKALPNTLSDIENHDMGSSAASSIKKGPRPVGNSFQDLRGFNSNYVKTDPGDGAYPPGNLTEKKIPQNLQEDMDLCYQEQSIGRPSELNSETNGSVMVERVPSVFSLNPVPGISELESAIGTANWHLQHRQMVESNRSLRDFQMFPKSDQIPFGSHPTTLLVVENNVQRVAETNL
ncbi:organic cation transporter protein-like [Brevipalpus obovatus]|uniref:organic cation transporter protein-like n=1 Tax=Brevipalpus obovatus TaxID=246614 RepID=UPI003D9F3C23